MKNTKRNWSQYNTKLKRSASIELYVTEDLYQNWYYKGSRKRGGKVIYADSVIEMGLIVREYYGLALRQTEGFLSSLFKKMDLDLKIPNYTTLSRRCGGLDIDIRATVRKYPRTEPLRIAMDSTGLSVLKNSDWHGFKHKTKTSRDKWRKLHIALDVDTFEVVSASYTPTSVQDFTEAKSLLDKITEPIGAVYGDLAYDTYDVREAIVRRGGREIIPVKKTAVHSDHLRGKRKRDPEVHKQRDDIINYLKYNEMGGSNRFAMANWKKLTGYHKRSLVESQMHRIKSHTSDKLTNIKENNRQTQAMIKIKIVNKINAIQI